jgi:drug/metabolite transporter (DMT)-like permease
MKPSLSGSLVGNGLFMVVVVVAATNYLVVKWALEEITPFTLMAIRYLLAASLITLMIIPKLSLINRSLISKSFMLGSILTLAVVTWQFGIYTSDKLGPAAFIVSLDGLMVPIFATLLFSERLKTATIIALPLAVLGLGLMNLRQGMSLAMSDIWFVVCAVAFALHIVLTHRHTKSFDPVCLAWGQLWVVAISCLVAALCFERGDVTFDNILSVKYEIFYLACIATALRFSLQNHVQKLTTAAKAGFMFALEPVVVALLGWSVLDEYLSWQQLLGCLLIFIAVVISQLSDIIRLTMRAGDRDKHA